MRKIFNYEDGFKFKDKFIIEVEDFSDSIEGYLADLSIKSGPEREKLLEMIDFMQFIQTIDEFIFLNSKAVKYLRRNILQAKVLLNFLNLIFKLINGNYHNLIIFFNVKSENFVTTFKFLGSSYYNFIAAISKTAFDGKYYFSNYFFIYDILYLSFASNEELNLTNEELNINFDTPMKEHLIKYDESLKFNDMIDSHSDSLAHVSINTLH